MTRAGAFFLFLADDRLGGLGMRCKSWDFSDSLNLKDGVGKAWFARAEMILLISVKKYFLVKMGRVLHNIHAIGDFKFREECFFLIVHLCNAVVAQSDVHSR